MLRAGARTAASAGPTYFAGSTQPSPRGMAARLELPRSRSAAALNVHPRTPRAATSLGPRLARNLARHSAGAREALAKLVGGALARGGLARLRGLDDGHGRRGGRRLACQDDVVGVAEHEHLRRPPDDPLQLHHRPHPQPEFPQQQVLDEVPRHAPGPERELPVADPVEAVSPHLEDEEIGAEKVVAPILEERRDIAVVLLPAARIQ